MKLAARVLFICFMSSIWSGTAFAGLFRAYLSASGLDTNSCNVQFPCRLLPAALAAVNAGGQIWIVDSANYNTGPVTINKSVTILAIPGAVGSIAGVNGDAIIINAPGGSVTLRNLDVSNLSAGVNGITVQNAETVHIEKVSLSGFNTDASSCININSPAQFHVFVDDSSLRECRNGIYANLSVALGVPSQLHVDNSRIEHPLNTGGANATGVWIQGSSEAVSARNSVITGGGGAAPPNFNAVQIDGLLASAIVAFDAISCELTAVPTGVLLANTAANAKVFVRILASQIHLAGFPMQVSNTAAGAYVSVELADTHIADSNVGGVQVSNSGNNTSRIDVNLIRSQMNVVPIALDVAATNGGLVLASVTDSLLASASGALLKTSGTGSLLHVGVIRSTLRNSTTAIDHGQGLVELDATHVSANSNDFVNNGSGNIVSLGNNFVNNNTNGSGFTYITPTIIAPK